MTPSAPLSSRARALGLLLLALWAAWAWAWASGIWHADLAAIWFAGHLHATGADDLIYAAPDLFFGGTPPAWAPLQESLGADAQNIAFPYIYPPLWAGIVAPFAEALSPRGYFRLVLAVHIAMLAGSVLMAERLARPGWMPPLVFIGWGVAGLSVTTVGDTLLLLNQPSITVAFLTLAALSLIEARPRLAGLALAGAAAIKITPIAFAALFVQARRPAALLPFALGVGALAMASVALMGWPLHRAFLEQLARAGETSVLIKVNPSLRVLALAAADGLGLAPMQILLEDRAGATVLVAMPAWPGRLAAGLALALGVPALALAARRHGRAARTLTALGLALGIFLFGPLSWLHYLLIPMLLLPALGATLGPRPTGAVMLAALAVHSRDLMALYGRGAEGSLAHGAVVCGFWLLVLGATLVALSRCPRD
ncbi:glycosyltransferase family 87 protein [Rhodobacter xanthinilyticus]|uniref:glycosyltransferase family 87 protein n=1 Tax=Rhodobacter xanthinilyticus TaxID=1850250 RepID=UPI0018DD0605|nr:glycosyltransferase family 87 protein [Rhodobacter xanthinilyticus]